MSTAPQPKWFVGLILLESTAAGDYAPLYEEEIVLVSAATKEEARTKVEQHATESTGSFPNAEGKLISWRLRKIVDVAGLPWGELSSGATLYSRHFRDIDAYERFEPLMEGSVD